MVHCRGIFAPIGEQVCDGSYIALVMKKVNGPALRFAIGLPPSRIKMRKGWASPLLAGAGAEHAGDRGVIIRGASILWCEAVHGEILREIRIQDRHELPTARL